MSLAGVKGRIAAFWRDKTSRRRLMLLLVSFLIYGIVISAIFAYYSAVDNVTNRISGKNIGLELYEPEWDAKGMFLAKKSEPGMVIPKDPYAKNTGELDEVVRLKLEIRLDESDAKLLSANNVYNDNLTSGEPMLTVADDTRRKIAILKAIMTSEDSYFMDIAPYEKQETKGNNITVTGDDGNRYFVQYKGQGFLVEAVTSGINSEKFDLYFYYIGNNIIGGTSGYEEDENREPYTREDTVLEILTPRDTTPRLFTRLVYPIYKKDYLTIFDQGYDINVYAEGILVKDFEGKPLTVGNFKRIANR